MQKIAPESGKEMRMLSDSPPAPAMVLSEANQHDVTDPMVQPSTSAAPSHEAIMKPYNAATPDEPFSLVPASVAEEPPPALTEVEYLVPAQLPQNDHKSDSGMRYPSLEWPPPPPPPPPPPELLSYSPPAPLSGMDNQVSFPPLMVINGSTLQTPHVLSPPAPKSNSNMSSRTLVGMIVGTSTMVTAVFFILALIIFCVRHIIKKNHGHFEDCPSSPLKASRRKLTCSISESNGDSDNIYAKVPDNLKQKMPAIGVHFIPATRKLFALPPTISNDGSPSSVHSESENFSPQGHVLGLSAGNFSYAELARATNDFASANLLGEGGFGYVHKGVLPSGREIAVKQLKIGSHQGEREFQAEIETISRVHHKHLVSLVGYCTTGFKRLLVYEFVCNGTLEFHLHEKQGVAGKQQPVMDWATRMKIAIGSAKGLAYLHEDCNPTIIHRDIKAANILLNSKYEAKVSDFGLAKFFCDSNHHISHISTRVVGTFGYLAPEYAQSGKVSEKSDVYSYGVMLLELITGSQPIIEMESTMSLASWARPLLRQVLENGNSASLVDPHLQGNYDAKEMANMVSCAAACVRYSSWRRPGMSQIVRALEGDASLLDVDEGITPGKSSRFFDFHTGDTCWRTECC